MKKKKSLVPPRRFNTATECGLFESEVRYNTEKGLVNKVPNKSNKSYLQIILKNIFTFFNILMTAIAVALIVIVGPEVILNLAYMIIIVFNVLIGTIQECKSKRTLDKLKLMNSTKCTVIREYEKVEILAENICLDEIIELKAGDQVPVDALIMTDDVIELDESMLTGESRPVKKTLKDKIFAGSYVVSGLCRVRADAIGADTYIHSLESKAKDFKKPKSRLMIAINKIIRTLACIAIPLAVVVFLNELVHTAGADYKNAVLFGGTTITYMIPAGMMLLTSIAMATGVVKLAKKKTLTQDLYSVEALSRVDTLCLDKTGTLTDGTMMVEDVILFSQDLEIRPLMRNYLSAFKTSNQTSTALLKHFGRKEKDEEYEVLHSIQFSSARKYSAVEFKDHGAFALGAPEYLTDREDILEKSQELARNGLRVIILVKLASTIEGRDDSDLPKRRTVIAMFVIRDNIRPEVPDTMAWFRENDVDIRVISGDNIGTVSYIAKQAGIKDWDKCVDMSTIESTDNIEKIVMENKIFGRVTPEQKAMIVDILKQNGRTVAMTGDGVNDIIALKKADCSIALANGSPATKNVSNLVLLDSDFSNMKNAVLEGRRVINNVQRSSTLFVMKDFLWLFITILPLLLGMTHIIEPTVMTLVNILITGIGSFFIAFEPDKRRIKGSFYKNVLGKAIIAGFFMFLPILFMYIYSLCRIGFDVTAVNEFISSSMMPVMSLCVTIAGFIIFFNICRPFTRFRAILFSSILAVVILLLLAVPEFFLMNGTAYVKELMSQGGIGEVIGYIFTNMFSFTIYRGFTLEQWLIVGIFLAISFVLYLVSNRLLTKFLDRTLFSKREFLDE